MTHPGDFLREATEHGRVERWDGVQDQQTVSWTTHILMSILQPFTALSRPKQPDRREPTPRGPRAMVDLSGSIPSAQLGPYMIPCGVDPRRGFGDNV